MKFDTTTLLGATAVVVILIVMLNKYTATNAILQQLAQSYREGVGVFLNA